jgi:nucleoside-diphosphate-sugar epimerase
MIKVAVIGAGGFVGSAFASHIGRHSGVELVEVTRGNYDRAAGAPRDIVIDASCNSRKYLAEENPFDEFALSVSHRLQTLRDFPADLQLHISSVDVYGDLSSPRTTTENTMSNLEGASNYGFHKLLAEQLVRRYSKNWLILRLAGMVGPGLRKNPVYDILHGNPLRIHPDSQYQFMTTADVAQIGWTLVERRIHGEVFNICGEGLISPREIASIARRELDLKLISGNDRPRIVHIDTSKIRQVTTMPGTQESIAGFLMAVSKHIAQGADSLG